MKYTIYLINFGYELEARFRSYPAALRKALDTGFECIIRCDGRDIETVRSI